MLKSTDDREGAKQEGKITPESSSPCLIVVGPRFYGPLHWHRLLILIGVVTLFVGSLFLIGGRVLEYGVRYVAPIIVPLISLIGESYWIRRKHKQELQRLEAQTPTTAESRRLALRFADMELGGADVLRKAHDLKPLHAEYRDRSIVITDDLFVIPEVIPGCASFEPVHVGLERERVEHVVVDAIPGIDKSIGFANRSIVKVRKVLLRLILGAAIALLPMTLISLRLGIVRFWGLPGFWGPIFASGIAVALGLYLVKSQLVIAPRVIAARRRPWHDWEVMRPVHGGLMFDARTGQLLIPRSSLGPLYLRCDLATGLLAAWAWVSEAESPTDEALKAYAGIR